MGVNTLEYKNECKESSSPNLCPPHKKTKIWYLSFVGQSPGPCCS